jgi:hypothetical protein
MQGLQTRRRQWRRSHLTPPADPDPPMLQPDTSGTDKAVTFVGPRPGPLPVPCRLAGGIVKLGDQD